MRFLLVPALCLAALAVAPLVAADDGAIPPPPPCTTETVGAGWLVLATVSYGTGCGVAVQPYTCDEVWYGGHGIGGFIFTCSPGLREPCLWPVCRP